MRREGRIAAAMAPVSSVDGTEQAGAVMSGIIYLPYWYCTSAYDVDDGETAPRRDRGPLPQDVAQ